ncbi:TetR/AcrR family transcriptional regulator [Haloprofundus halophilus]|uniref:TetR/AcrR family transcriptional regulator n=1 Tax=Haloprofundus halophilus TaxID=2283527 RepID=UPI000E44127B|nr:TetR/AcrR family transcriptional regulator [Haloprofundus halophilus]
MRGFTDAERERIERELVAAGRELFAQYGLGKTTIAELTDSVGIAPSTFYQFFDSKEALYLHILEGEGERLVGTLHESLSDVDDAESGVRTLLDVLMRELETNPLVRTLVSEEELGRLRAQFTDEAAADARARKTALLRSFIEQWEQTGLLAEEDPDVVADVLRAATFVTLYREEFDDYDRVRDALVDVVAVGVTADRR